MRVVRKEDGMLPGTDSAVGKAVYAVVGIALIGFAVWRITSATKGSGGDVPYTVLCTECQHSETRQLPPGDELLHQDFL